MVFGGPHELHKISTAQLHFEGCTRLMLQCSVAFLALRTGVSVASGVSAMSERHQHAPRCVSLLADSLDSILAVCEDLLIPKANASPERFRLELAAITLVLQARRHMEELDAMESGVLDAASVAAVCEVTRDRCPGGSCCEYPAATVHCGYFSSHGWNTRRFRSGCAPWPP